MRALALGLLAACASRQPFAWLAPAAASTPEAPCEAAPPELSASFARGWRLDGQAAAALFPDLGLLASWVGRAELRAGALQRCGGHLVVRDPELRFWNRRGQPLEVALITDALVHPRMVLALEREGLQVAPPEGAWLAPDRHRLSRVGWVAVARLGE
jgi:hypothetical protein